MTPRSRCSAPIKSPLIVCSALKKTYRDLLRDGNPNLSFIYLKGDFGVIESRLKARKGHFFKTQMLVTQFEALQEPGADEQDVLVVDIDQPLEGVVASTIEVINKKAVSFEYINASFDSSGFRIAAAVFSDEGTYARLRCFDGGFYWCWSLFRHAARQNRGDDGKRDGRHARLPRPLWWHWARCLARFCTRRARSIRLRSRC